LFDEGKALMAASKAHEACPKFEESQRLDPGSGTLLNLAKCYEQTARLASAWSTYLEAASVAKATGNAEREQGARALASALAPRLSRLAVKVAPEARVAGLEVLRDGIAIGTVQWGVALPANEGDHEIVARAPGHQDWKGMVKVAGEGTMAAIEIPGLSVAAGSPAGTSGGDRELEKPPSGLGTQRILALVSGGVGVAGLAVGAIFGLKAIDKKSDADAACNGSSCSTDEAVAAGNDAQAAGNVATLGMIVGAVGLAGGAALWFTAPTEGPAIQAGLGYGTLHVRGVW
jgi:hypothetical protein